MDIVPVFVGLDYHDESIEVDVMTGQGEILASRRCPNDWKAVVAVVPQACRVVGVAIEACCGAADFAEELIQRAGWSVDLAHPGFVARMKQNPDKTDFGDAKMLADLERVGYLPRPDVRAWTRDGCCWEPRCGIAPDLAASRRPPWPIVGCVGCSIRPEPSVENPRNRLSRERSNPC